MTSSSILGPTRFWSPKWFLGKQILAASFLAQRVQMGHWAASPSSHSLRLLQFFVFVLSDFSRPISHFFYSHNLTGLIRWAWALGMCLAE
jgi:hypothetical protein